jgi:hypothetical protein
MKGGKLHIKISLFFVIISVLTFAGYAQNGAPKGEPVMWSAVDIPTRDLYLGPGGSEMQPDLKKATFLGQQPGGNNLKYRIKDASGREWVAKIADESQSEVAAVRLLWGIGYKTEIDYLAPRMSIANKGNYKNVRMEARLDHIKRGERWSWIDNPFSTSKEFQGLKIMMALINNWDLKDENNVVLTDKSEQQYVIADLGSSFGRLANSGESRSGRSVNKPEHYAESEFIRGVKGGEIDFAYNGQRPDLLTGIKVENGRWLADLLLQLTDKQIEDAFRAANYKPEEISILAQAFKKRVNDLDAATRNAVSAN